MREIKFRAWYSKASMFVYFDLNKGFGSDQSLEVYRDLILNGTEFQQHTGLKDKNGKEIYTKDIFDIGQTVNGQSRFVLMECIGGFDVRYAHDLNRKYEYDVNDLLKPSRYEGVVEFEVIGNIYENENLLNGSRS